MATTRLTTATAVEVDEVTTFIVLKHSELRIEDLGLRIESIESSLSIRRQWTEHQSSRTRTTSPLLRSARHSPLSGTAQRDRTTDRLVESPSAARARSRVIGKRVETLLGECEMFCATLRGVRPPISVPLAQTG